MKKHFVLKLIPPRATFSQDMTAEERAIMHKHIAYWTGLMNEGHVLAFGPVLDPQGVYGLGLIEAENEDQVKEFMANDPAISVNRYEYCPMLAVVPNKT